MKNCGSFVVGVVSTARSGQVGAGFGSAADCVVWRLVWLRFSFWPGSVRVRRRVLAAGPSGCVAASNQCSARVAFGSASIRFLLLRVAASLRACQMRATGLYGLLERRSESLSWLVAANQDPSLSDQDPNPKDQDPSQVPNRGPSLRVRHPSPARAIYKGQLEHLLWRLAERPERPEHDHDPSRKNRNPTQVPNQNPSLNLAQVPSPPQVIYKGKPENLLRRRADHCQRPELPIQVFRKSSKDTAFCRSNSKTLL